MSASLRRLGRPLPAAGFLFATTAGALIAGLAFGNLFVAGQAEPGQWLWPELAAMVLLGLLARRAPFPSLLLVCGWAGSLSAIFLLCGVAGQFWPWRAMAELSLWSLLALAAGWMVSGKRRWRWAGLVALGLLLLPAIFGRDGGEAVRLSPMRLDVLAGSLLLQQSPTFLRTTPGRPIDEVLGPVDVRAHDRLTPQALAQAKRLLLAQPRLLESRELVAIDAWVRRGGKAVILADPLLSWPDATGGIHNSVPATSLLDPLLGHWGLKLEPVTEGQEGAERRFLSNGALLALASASRFSSLGRPSVGSSCRLIEGGLIALCRIGSGQVRLVADADWLHDGLWLADPEGRVRRGNLVSDNLMLLNGWLAAPLAEGRPPSRPINWASDDRMIVRGTRLALLAGLCWAMLGAAVLCLRNRRKACRPRIASRLASRTSGEHTRSSP